eukprot:4115693-Ditylum_brightwellii.AAC.1
MEMMDCLLPLQVWVSNPEEGQQQRQKEVTYLGELPWVGPTLDTDQRFSLVFFTHLRLYPATFEETPVFWKVSTYLSTKAG